MLIQDMIQFLKDQGLIKNADLKEQKLEFSNGQSVDFFDVDRAEFRRYIEGMVKTAELMLVVK